VHVRQKRVLVANGSESLSAYAPHARAQKRVGPDSRVSLRTLPQVAPRAPLGKMNTDDGIVPPSSVNVDGDGRCVLYAADGTPLKRQIGFMNGR
jgi:hypothetical protein